MADVEQYQISVSDDQLESLSQKLALASFPDELDETGWEYGAPLADIKRLTNYWKDGFNWKQEERKLNELPQFQTKIQAKGFDPLNIHFLHQKSGVKGAVPLLFVHGCMLALPRFFSRMPLLIDYRARKLHRSDQNALRPDAKQ